MGNDARRHLVALGCGPSHIFLLRSLAARPEPGLQVTLVSERPYASHTPMVPGLLAGQYRMEEIQVDVQSLAARAQTTFLMERVARIDSEAKLIHLEHRPPLAYDLLSIDISLEPPQREGSAAADDRIVVWPAETAVERMHQIFSQPPPANGRRVVLVGAGAEGVELAFGIAARLRWEGKGSLTVVERAPLPVPNSDPRTSQLVKRALERQGIELLTGSVADEVYAGAVYLADGRQLPADLVIWATRNHGPALLTRSGLLVDERGFLAVGDDLRCTIAPEIFAAGYCATIVTHSQLPMSSAALLRQAQVLNANLRALARGSARLKNFRRPRRPLRLFSTADGKAILNYGRFTWKSRLAWNLKDRMDRGFIKTHARPPLQQQTKPNEEAASTPQNSATAADLLERVLTRLPLPRAENVMIGAQHGDAAAVFAQPPGSLAVASVDVLEPFSDDLYFVGRVAATNAASDLYAMGAEGSAALAMVCLPHGSDRHSEEKLEHFLSGAIAQLTAMAIPLTGGHAITGDRPLFGFSMHGWVAPDRILRKSGARPGDRLVLTKPLGNGVLLTAARAGVAPAEWITTAHAAMVHGNGPAMRLLREHGAHACTSVNGFGLAGHLTDLLRGGPVSARIYGNSLPALPGAIDLLAAQWRSATHTGNEHALQRTFRADPNLPSFALCFDPQVSGGLLAAVPRDRLDELHAAFAAAGESLAEIGEIYDGPGDWELER